MRTAPPERPVVEALEPAPARAGPPSHPSSRSGRRSPRASPNPSPGRRPRDQWRKIRSRQQFPTSCTTESTAAPAQDSRTPSASPGHERSSRARPADEDGTCLHTPGAVDAPAHTVTKTIDEWMHAEFGTDQNFEPRTLPHRGDPGFAMDYADAGGHELWLQALFARRHVQIRTLTRTVSEQLIQIDGFDTALGQAEPIGQDGPARPRDGPGPGPGWGL